MDQTFESRKKISNMLSRTVLLRESYYIVASGSGKIITKSDPTHIICKLNHWHGIIKIAASELENDFAVCYGLSSDGKIVAASKSCQSNIENLNKIKFHSLSYVGLHGIIGLDTQGKLHFSDPRFVFDEFDFNDATAYQNLNQLVTTVEGWPSLVQAFKIRNGIIGVTEDGKVVSSFLNLIDSKPVDDTILDVLSIASEWDNIERIVLTCSDDFYSKYSISAVHKDGTIISTGKNPEFNDRVVQIARLKRSMFGNKVLYLTETGDMFCGNTLVSSDVVSIIVDEGSEEATGFIQSDGSIHLLRNQIPDWMENGLSRICLFTSVDTILTDWGETISAAHAENAFEAELQNNDGNDNLTLDTLINDIDILQDELKKYQHRYEHLGIFHKNEKAALENKISEIETQICEKSSKVFPSSEKLLEEIEIKLHKVPKKEVYVPSGAMPVINSYQKDRSVIKDAVVGGVIAGPAGAVVGALHAVDKNNRKR